MAKKIESFEVPLSYSAYLILLSLRDPSHGYEIMKYVEEATKGLFSIGPATMYRTISEFLDADLIELVSEENKKKIYRLTTKGQELVIQQNEFLALLGQIAEDRRSPK